VNFRVDNMVLLEIADWRIFWSSQLKEDIVNIFSRSWLIARCLIWVKRQVTLVEQSWLTFRCKWVCADLWCVSSC